MNLNFEKDIKPYLLNDKRFYNRRKTESQWLEKHHPEWLQFFNSVITETDNIPEKIYCLDHNYTEIPKCSICGKPLKFKSYANGYQDYCSRACRFSEEAWKKSEEKQKKTNLERYGVEYTSQAAVKKEKTLQTNLKRYGVTNPSKTKEIQDKIKRTVQERYGTDVYWKSEDFKKKASATWQKKYGVDWISKADKIKEKAKEVFIKKYGVDNPFKLEKSKKNQKENYHKKAIKNIQDTKGYEIEFIDDKTFKVKNGCKIHGDIIIKNSIFYTRTKPERLAVAPLCPICNPIASQSSGIEITIKNFLDLLGVNYIENNRKLLGGQELDIIIPDKKIAIECNGIYWHSEIFKLDKKYHQNKSLKCKNAGYQLIHIWEDDLAMHKDIIFDYLKSKLGLVDKKIYARKCNVKELSVDLCKKFLSENHIQGFIGSKIKYGLFYNDELVACMTFGPLRKALGQSAEPEVFELYRFAVKQGYSVIGAASKLLSHFKKNNSWKEIITYAKLDYSNGNMYEKIGFEYDSITPPNYFWVSKNFNLRKNRFNFRKSEISDESNKHMTEVEIMHSKGYYRCFDAGNLKYIMKNNGR